VCICVYKHAIQIVISHQIAFDNLAGCSDLTTIQYIHNVIVRFHFSQHVLLLAQ